MPTREAIIAALQELKPRMRDKYKVRRIGLFGSFARGDQTKDSDVDVLVDVDPSIGIAFVDMAEEIEACLGIKTDVVTEDGIKPRYRSYIQKDLIDV